MVGAIVCMFCRRRHTTDTNDTENVQKMQKQQQTKKEEHERDAGKVVTHELRTNANEWEMYRGQSQWYEEYVAVAKLNYAHDVQRYCHV